MIIDHGEQVRLGIDIGLTELASYEGAQANCMFQLALMVARIAVEPCPDRYRDEAAQALLSLIRAKPKGNVVRLAGPSRRLRQASQGCAPPTKIASFTS